MTEPSALDELRPSPWTQMTERSKSDRSSPSPKRWAALGLALPMAVIGAAGGWLTADLLPFTNDGYVRGVIAIDTVLMTAGLGAWLGARPRRGGAATIAVAVLATVLAGVVNGAVIGALLMGADGPGFGVVMGAIYAMPFIPVVVGLVLLARRIGRARVGSIVDRVDRRMVWIGALTPVALAAALPDVPVIKSDLTRISCSLPIGAAIAVGALLLLDVAALVRARALAARDRELVAREPGMRDAAPDIIDVGLGDEERVAVGRPWVAYRDRDQVILVVRGNPALAARAIAYSLAIDGAALIIALGSAWVRIAKELGAGAFSRGF